jgi:8-oxo-dGTP diphosphatase
MEIKLFVAIKAFIKFQDKILILRESRNYVDGANAGRFDVVGGRVKPGEPFDQSLLREIKEETGLAVKIGRPFFMSEWRPVVKGEQWHIVGTFIECFADTDKVVLSEDHEEFLWINPKGYSNYNLIENLKPAFEGYLSK